MKTIVITGASDGIGASAARELASLGHKVVVVGRNPEKTANLARSIGADFYVADFSKLAEVSSLAEDILSRYKQIDVLIHNAGLLAHKERTETEDGFELTFQVNHLAPFLLNTLLLPLLHTSQSRVIVTASRAHLQGKLDFANLQLKHGYSPYKAYANTKLMNVIFAHELARRTQQDSLQAVSFHPGVVSTQFGLDSDSFVGKMYRSIAQHFMRTPEEGSKTLVWLATTDNISSGMYYVDNKIAKQHPSAFDPKIGLKLWDETSSLVS